MQLHAQADTLIVSLQHLLSNFPEGTSRMADDISKPG